jgi:uncharacterized protein (TIGR03437 family)
MRILLCACLCFAVPLPAQELRTTQIASGVNSPTDIQNSGDGSGRLYFVQQDGIVRIFRNGALVTQPFLDIRSKTHAEGERGLLGLAFPPGFAQKQRFYLNYTDLNGNTVIAQYRVSANPDIADAASETVLLNITQPFPNHNGGQLRFGPDGYFYIGMGDGGSGGDPMGNGQSLGTLLGKMLRIDVESDPGHVQIPPDNPFVNRAGARPEIWAYGLRNPWRFTFDRATRDLWIGDVGQNIYEEIDFQPAGSRGGENYGWNRMEGLHCFVAACSMAGLTLPVAEYTHSDGCSVTGGSVYRGSLSPGLRGIYIYGDYCTGRIWGIERRGSEWVNRLLLSSGLSITTFGEDEAGELYLGSGNGRIYHIEGSLAPRFTVAGVVNAASFAPGLVPGSLGTLFAAGVLDNQGIVSTDRIPLPTSLQEVSITVDGIAAPINTLANNNGQEQINFQVPIEIAGRPTASVIVTRQGAASAAVVVPVVELQPAVYTSDGTQAVVIHNADYTLATATRPLVPGEFAFVYATGLGAVDNQPPTGDGGPVTPLARALTAVRVTLAGLQCDVQYAGLAPGLVGVYQVNFRVPANVPNGSQELALTAGGTSSPAARVFVR